MLSTIIPTTTGYSNIWLCSPQLGPNVSVGRNAEVGEGVRIRESIVLGAARVRDHTLVLHSVLGWDSVVGAWSRIEGTPCDPDPNKPFAKMDNISLFNGDGKLNPSITILGRCWCWCGGAWVAFVAAPE